MAPDMDCESLGPLDHISPHNIPQSVMYLSLKREVRPIDAFVHLQEGLRLTVQRIPWLRGVVHWQSPETPGWRPGMLEIRYSSSSKDEPDLLRLQEHHASKPYADLRDAGFPLDTFEDDEIIWTRPWNSDFEKGVPLFSAQANFVPGGCILAFSVSSQASDGTAMLMIIKLWADLCNGISLTNKITPPKGPTPENLSFDRSVLDQALIDHVGKQPSPNGRTEDGILRHLVGMDPTADQVSHPNKTAMQHVIFYMPHKAYTALRKECVDQFSNMDITGNDLICALIWRSIMRARAATNTTQTEYDASTMSVLLRPFDARPHVAHMLPATYLGNLNFENRVAMPLNTLISADTSIPSIAHKISKAVNSQNTPENLLDAYKLLRSATDYGQVQWGATHATGTTVGILSPIVLPFNDTCFGEKIFGNGGKPDAFRPIMGASNRALRTCFVIPRKKHGGLEFVMTVSDEELDFLCEDEEFSRCAFSL